MCLAIPMQVTECREFDATAEVGGIHRTVSLLMCPEASLGDYVLVHAGYAITLIDEEEAQRTLELIEQVVGPVTAEMGGVRSASESSELGKPGELDGTEERYAVEEGELR